MSHMRTGRRRRVVRTAVLLVAAVMALALGGCRGGVTAAPGSTGSVPVSAAGAGPDPLGSVEATLDQIEKQVDQDGTG